MQLLRLIKATPKARERRNKNRAIAYVLREKYINRISNLDLGFLTDLVVEANTLDREWRKIMQENPELRGTDYEKKQQLVQAKQIELGYVPGFHGHVKKMGRLLE